MVKITVMIMLIFGAGMLASSQAQTQSPAAMQAQEAAADAQVSTSGTATYPTPYKLFQRFYAAVSGTSSTTLYALFTKNALNSAFDNDPPTTQAQFAAIDAGDVAAADADFTLISFVFTPDPKRPKVTTVITYTRKDPNSSGRLGIKETNELTLIDTGMGWMIDHWSCY